VGAFLAEHPGLIVDPIRPDELPGIQPFVDAQGWLRTTPADLDVGKASLSGLDGFFAARLQLP
jgi:16S rRNA (cytosine967-C5)-methyltransferase